jgi:hypothetical protein
MSTHRLQVLRRFHLPHTAHPSLEELSKLARIPLPVLQQVYNRGIGAWKTNPASVRVRGTFEKNPDMARYPRSARLPKEQWAMARVYSFIDRGKTFFTADADLARMV